VRPGGASPAPSTLQQSTICSANYFWKELCVISIRQQVCTRQIFSRKIGQEDAQATQGSFIWATTHGFESLKLPHSHKEYVRRYNEEIERKVKETELSKALARQAQALKKDSAAALVAKLVALLE
jgi:hypothetical protein